MSEGGQPLCDSFDMCHVIAIASGYRARHAHSAFGDAAQLHNALGNHIHLGLDGLVNFVEEFVQPDNARAFHVPMRLFHLHLKDDRRFPLIRWD
jgi:hypothetical protein